MSNIEYIDASTCNYYNRFLAMKVGSSEFKRDSQIASHTVLIQDNYSVDFNLVNGDELSGPYLDVVLFEDAIELQTLPASRTRIEGTYRFFDPTEERELVLEIRREA